MIYGTTLKLPEELFITENDVHINFDFVKNLRDIMQQLKPVPAANHSTNKTFIQKDLHKCTHVFLRDDTVRTPLKSPYDGPFKVVEKGKKTFDILINNKIIKVSIDRIKAAHIEASTEGANNNVKTTKIEKTATNNQTYIDNENSINISNHKKNKKVSIQEKNKYTNHGRKINRPIRYSN